MAVGHLRTGCEGGRNHRCAAAVRAGRRVGGRRVAQPPRRWRRAVHRRGPCRPDHRPSSLPRALQRQCRPVCLHRARQLSAHPGLLVTCSARTFVATGVASGMYPLAVRPSVTSDLTASPAAVVSAVLRPVRAISTCCAPVTNRVMAVPSTPPKWARCRPATRHGASLLVGSAPRGTNTYSPVMRWMASQQSLRRPDTVAQLAARVREVAPGTSDPESGLRAEFAGLLISHAEHDYVRLAEPAVGGHDCIHRPVWPAGERGQPGAGEDLDTGFLQDGADPRAHIRIEAAHDVRAGDERCLQAGRTIASAISTPM